jgi:hypothetical protein
MVLAIREKYLEVLFRLDGYADAKTLRANKEHFGVEHHVWSTLSHCAGRIILLLYTICQPRGSIHIHSLPYNSITLPYNFWHYWRRRRRRRFSDNKTKVAPRSSSGCG